MDRDILRSDANDIFDLIDEGMSEVEAGREYGYSLEQTRELLAALVTGELD